jgi:phage FluMu protein Com
MVIAMHHDLSTLAGLHEHQQELNAHCPRCDAWRVLPLGEWVRQGKGSLRLPLRVRCRDCGEVGQLQVRPPMPTWTNTSGWIQLN